jgi:hypothetical protein
MIDALAAELGRRGGLARRAVPAVAAAGRGCEQEVRVIVKLP